MASTTELPNKDTIVLDVTVAGIDELPGDHFMIRFYESARGYMLYRTNEHYNKILKLLRASIKKKIMLQIICTETTDRQLVINDAHKKTG